MLSNIITLSTLASLALAQSTITTSLFFQKDPTYPIAQWDASVINVGQTATTYAVQCNTNCMGLTQSLTLTEEPALYEFAFETSTAGATGSVSESCSLAGTTSALCVASASLAAAGQQIVTAVTSTISPLTYEPVTITAGVEKLGSVTASATATATALTTTSQGASLNGSGVDATVTSAAASASATHNAASGTLVGRSGEWMALALLPTFAALIGAVLIIA